MRVKNGWQKSLGVATTVGLTLLLGPGVAWAQEDAATVPVAVEEGDEGTAVVTEEAIGEVGEEEDGFFSYVLAATIGTRVGQGTFVSLAEDSPNAQIARERAEEMGMDPDNAYDRAVLTLSLDPKVGLGKDFYTGASIAWTQWLTAGAGDPIGGATANEAAQLRFNDIGLSFGYNGYTIEETGTTLAAEFGLGLPTSVASQVANQIVDTNLSLVLSQKLIGNLGLSYVLVGGKTFHSLETPSIDIEQTPADVLFRRGGAEDIGGGVYALDGYNIEYYMLNILSASVKIWELNLGVQYRYDRFWTYDRDNDDEFRNPNAQAGRQAADLVRGRVSLSYAPLEWLNLTGGIATVQNPMTDDQRTFNFPFWNFNSAAENSSTVFLSATASYSL